MAAIVLSAHPTLIPPQGEGDWRVTIPAARRGAMAQPRDEYATTAELQFFDVAAALANGDGMHSRVDMAKSPNSYIAVFGVGPRLGETRVHSHPDSDQILFILKGECTVEGLSGRYVLESDEGVLI